MNWRGAPDNRFLQSLVKQARGLRDKKNGAATGFLAEGLRILTEARDSGTLPEPSSTASPPIPCSAD